jgi:biotin transporter BioY
MEKMFEKGLWKNRNNPSWKKNRYGSRAGMLLLSGGVVIIVSGLIYMFVHLDTSDTFFPLWLPYIITGIAMVCISLLLKMPVKRSGRYNR